jgi:1,4-alpha-glucan branching enzyme
MTLTNDTFYCWCTVPALQAPPGTRYRFLLNDEVEVIDPAARAVQDGGSLKTSFGEDPGDPSTSWSVVIDVAAVSAAAHTQPWQKMGWQNFLIYEIHARRFSNLQPGTLTSFDLLADELNATSRLGQPGYLSRLPVTIFGLMPVSEFSSAVSWGYDPSFHFAIDEFYGGAPALARFVSAAHASGRGVTLDVVYNHSLGSSLMSIAPDVYRNGDYDGDRMNCGHPTSIRLPNGSRNAHLKPSMSPRPYFFVTLSRTLRQLIFVPDDESEVSISLRRHTHPDRRRRPMLFGI